MEVTQAVARPQAPSRSLVQRMTALGHANDIRTRRAGLKRDLKAGRESVPTLIADTPEWLETMKLWDLLMAVPKFGRVKVNRLLTMHRISPSKTVGGLSDRQRGEILRALR